MSVGDAIALAAAASWAVTGILARFLSPWLSPIAYNGIRCVVAGLAMALAVPWALSGPSQGLTLAAVLMLTVSTVVGIGLGDTIFFASIKRIGIARAVPIANTFPVLTALMAVLLFGATISVLLVVGMVVVGLGVWLITSAGDGRAGSRRDRREYVGGLLMSAVAALSWATSATLLGAVLEQIDALLAAAIRLPLAAAILLIYARRRALPGRLPAAIVVWALIAALATIASTMLFMIAITHVGAARTAAITSSSPLFTAPVGVLLFRERITPRLALGIAITVAGVVMIVAG